MTLLSDSKLRALKPRPKAYEISDGGGFYVCVLTSGTISFRYQYRFEGRKQRVVIGNYPALPLGLARQVHRKYQNMVAQGVSPARHVQEENQRKRGLPGDLFQPFAEAWIAQWGSNKDADTVMHVRRWLANDVYPQLAHLSVKAITPAHVLSVLDRIKARGAPHSARRTRGILKQIFDHAANRLLIDINPVDRIKPSSIASVSHRDRVLSREEIREFLCAISTSSCREQSKIALRLLMLTTVRKGELLQARWPDVDFQARVWLVPHTKNGKPLEVYLSRQAVELFTRLKELAGSSPFVLPHVSHVGSPMGNSTLNEAIRRIIAQDDIQLARFSVHDLRRTASTHLHEIGFPYDVIEKALNHTIGGVRGVYNKAAYADQRRDMLQTWADIVDGWAKSDNKIVSLHQVQNYINTKAA